MFPSSRKLEKSHLGASTFFASAHPSESCGSNGLPLTPNSIRIYGHSQNLFLINHPHLCSYIDVIRGKHERIIVIQEYHDLNLRTALEKYKILQKEESFIQITHEILQGLIYLNKFGTVCRNLKPETILIDSKFHVKLYDYGLYYMTEAGSTISFPIGSPKYLPPELLITDFLNDGQPLGSSGIGSPCWDSWSLGIILLEMLLGVNFYQCENVSDIITQTLSMAMEEQSFVNGIAKIHGLSHKLEELNPKLLDFINKCLTVDPKMRPSPSSLIQNELFKPSDNIEIILPHFPAIDPLLCLTDITQYKAKLGLSEEDLKDVLPNGSQREQGVFKEDGLYVRRFREIDHLSEKSIRMIFYFWKLVGGSVEHELKKQKLIRIRPSVLCLPSVMSIEGEIFGEGFERQELLPTSTIILPLENLKKRLAHVPAFKFYPLITDGETGVDDSEITKLPLIIREKDVEYQFHRVLLFERLLKAYPYKLDAIIREARRDIPPFFRSLIWASLLRVDGAVRDRYEQIDKETPTSTDRQIEVDIPRCHQYNELLSSPQGHTKFTKILKAWVVSHPHLVYWQGLDSLCAPFLYLNFENEGLAYACLSAFISKYLHNFFLRDNSAVIQEYLAKFSHLIAFHDPQLFNHLQNIGFVPELYAIPWFLTMFTHVFPLHKIFLLWDTLLLGNSSLPLCVGVALLRQLKDRLLVFGFNECILLFSDMPDINMEQVVEDAVEVFCSTPSSLVFRSRDSKASPERMKTDTNQLSGELMMDAVPLAELKVEHCGRISGAELLELMAQSRSSKGNKTKVLVLDVRSNEEFGKGSLNGSVSLPFDSIFSPEGELLTSSLSDLHNSFKGKILVVVGSANYHSQMLKVAHSLISRGYPRVCTLHKGVEVFRTSGHLIVPSG